MFHVYVFEDSYIIWRSCIIWRSINESYPMEKQDVLICIYQRLKCILISLGQKLKVISAKPKL